MKKLFIIIVLIASGNLLNAQTKSCCSAAHESFASFSADANFVNKHEEPVPFTYLHGTGKMITFKTNDGKDGSAFFIPAKTETKNYVFVFHEWWGLNDYIKAVCDKLYHDLGVNIIAPDLFDGNIASTREDAQKFMQSLNTERASSIILGALNYTGADSKIATIGWCMGGGWSMQASLLAGNQAVACVMYYGMPETDPEKLKNLNADVLFIHATQDKWINDEVVNAFENKMKGLNKNVQVVRYDADHAFANPSNPKHNKEFSDEAYRLSVAFIKQHF